MTLLDVKYISDLTGLDVELILPAYLELAEAKVKELLGYLKEEERVKTYIIFNPTKLLSLDEPNATDLSIQTRMSSGDFTVTAEDTYRFVSDRGIILFDGQIAEDTEVQVTYTLGWTRATIPQLVKLLIALVTIDIIDHFKPGTVNDSDIKSKKIGDYTVTYSDNKTAQKLAYSRDDIEHLVTLIKQGTFEPSVQL